MVCTVYLWTNMKQGVKAITVWLTNLLQCTASYIRQNMWYIKLNRWGLQNESEAPKDVDEFMECVTQLPGVSLVRH